MKKCENCKHGKKRGRTMIYCTLFGIDISAGYDRCKYHLDRIVLEDGKSGIIIQPDVRRVS